jgi:hypothetical protein
MFSNYLLSLFVLVPKFHLDFGKTGVRTDNHIPWLGNNFVKNELTTDPTQSSEIIYVNKVVH